LKRKKDRRPVSAEGVKFKRAMGVPCKRNVRNRTVRYTAFP